MNVHECFGIPVIQCAVAVVGSGAAGLNAAGRLWQYGQRDVVIVTEGVNNGTSRNTGSDKQTYYKLTLSGDEPDSVLEMAKTLYAGRCVDGDIALCEAALSVQSFLHLVELGVPFPRNRYGEYIGYKTDHDPRRRATSAGPYTSRMMTECLESDVREKQIPVFDGWQVISVLKSGERACGLLCLDLTKTNETKEPCFSAIACKDIVWATGGPAGIYEQTVYPIGHHGTSGVMFEAGALGRNLTEWQYGLASVAPRWNVSGTYMQVLPRFVSAAQDGSDQREFLYDFFQDEGTLLSNVFLKGYQWPFDVRKVAEGSSIIDILVYLETCKGRRVFLDYRTNPGNKAELDYHSLTGEAEAYLQKAGACFGTPIQRLQHMNAPAVSFYRDKGVDLYHDMLEIALCAQHNNGGIAVDCWWRTKVPNLLCVGEAAATHGVYRPGGSALNAGQVGSMRAAMYVAAHRDEPAVSTSAFENALEETLAKEMKAVERALQGHGVPACEIVSELSHEMSIRGAAIRSRDGLRDALKKLQGFDEREVALSSVQELSLFYQLKDMKISQQMYLTAMLDYCDRGLGSRGSALYTDMAGNKPYDQLPETFTYRLCDDNDENVLQEISYGPEGCLPSWRKAKEIPVSDDFFENVWREYRETGSVD